MIEMEPIIFKNETEEYHYHFSYVNMLGGELAKEAGEFRIYQLDSLPDDFKTLLKTGGAEWRFIIVRYLLREFKDGIMQKFDKGLAETKVDQFLRELPLNESPKLDKIIMNFFLNIEKEKEGLTILQSYSSKKKEKMLYQTLNNLIMKEGKKPISKGK